MRCLAARLALAGGRTVGAGVLVEAIWGAQPPAEPVHALQTLVWRLRKVLGSADAVTQVSDGYRLAVRDADVDVLRFEGQAAAGRESLHAGDPRAAVDVLGAAVTLPGLRPGAEPALLAALFGGVYAPSTLGSFLRFFTWGHALQLEAAARDLLASLAARTPLLPGASTPVYVDIDSLLRRVYGHAKQGAGFGHTKVGGYSVRLRGLSPLVATISTDRAALVIAATRLRGGSAGSARGAQSLLRQAIATARACGATGRILVRADSAFGSSAVVSACRKAGVNVSTTDDALAVAAPCLLSRPNRLCPDPSTVQVDPEHCRCGI